MSEKLPVEPNMGRNVMKRTHKATSKDSLSHDPRVEAAQQLLRTLAGTNMRHFQRVLSDLLAVVDELQDKVRFYEAKVDKWAQAFDQGYNAAIGAAWEVASDEAYTLGKECAAETPGTPAHDELSLMLDTAVAIRSLIAALRKGEDHE